MAVSEKLSVALFFEKTPALVWALATLVGIRVALFREWSWSAVLCALLLLLPQKRLLLLVVATVSALWVQFFYPFPNRPIEGKAQVSFSRMVKKERGWSYHANVTFWDEQRLVARQLPLSLFFLSNQPKPDPDGSYELPATLFQKGRYWSLKWKKGIAWQPLHLGWQVKWRYAEQEKFTAFLKEKYLSSAVASLLTGMTLGINEDSVLRFWLSRLGLQHLLAVSGFHFSLIMMATSYLLLRFLPDKLAYCMLFVLLSSYTFLLGSSPSVFRAWIMALIGLSALLFERKGNPLNALGVALFFALWLDPWVTEALGFQLSFLITASLLLFSPLFVTRLKAAGVRKWLAELVAILSSVQLAVLPLTASLNGYWTAGSLIYNTFIPFLVTISLWMLGAALFLGLFLPFLGDRLHEFNNWYTGLLLRVLEHPPAFVLAPIGVAAPSLLFYFSALFLLGVILSVAAKQESVLGPYLM